MLRWRHGKQSSMRRVQQVNHQQQHPSQVHFWEMKAAAKQSLNPAGSKSEKAKEVEKPVEQLERIESAALAAVPQEAQEEAAPADPALAGEDNDDDESSVHGKYNIGVFNWGSLRKRGEDIYARNVYNLPIFVALTMEMTPKSCRAVQPPDA